MATILNRTQTFATYGTVTAAGLHNLIDDTSIYAGLITTQTELTTVGTADQILIAVGGVSDTGAPRRVTVQNLFDDSLTTGTATLGTIASTTINNSGLATVGTLQVGASGPKLTVVSYGTAAFTSATVAAHNGADATTGTFALTGVALNDIVIGSLNSMGSATGTVNIGLSIYPNATNVVEYSIQNQGATAGTIPAGIFSVAALRFTA